MSEYCAGIMRVLGDETRLGVVRQLLQTPKNVSELNHVLPVSQSLLSHHLKILRDAGLVVAKRVGKAVLYDIAPNLKQESTSVIDLGCCRLGFQETDIREL